MKHILTVLILVSFAYAGERNVLIEMFTNSHCSVCPGAHAALNSYKSSSGNASRMRYIFYHTTFPYSDDPLSLANTTEPNARNSYYNGPTSTPNTFFDGANQGRTYSSFAANLDARMSVESPLGIVLSGKKNGSVVTVAASILQSGAISHNDLVVHMVAVENVTYIGRNGVSPQDFVMRKMITPIAGDPITLGMNVSKQVLHSAELKNIGDMNKVGVVVFVQSVSAKEVLQSQYISYASLTGVLPQHNAVPLAMVLEQNFPNPFNPSTRISFSIPREGFTSLAVYDLLGNEKVRLVNESRPAGTYSEVFNASQFPSGVYFYSLQSGGFVSARKMLLIK